MFEKSGSDASPGAWAALADPLEAVPSDGGEVVPFVELLPRLVPEPDPVPPASGARGWRFPEGLVATELVVEPPPRRPWSACPTEETVPESPERGFVVDPELAGVVVVVVGARPGRAPTTGRVDVTLPTRVATVEPVDPDSTTVRVSPASVDTNGDFSRRLAEAADV
jgi:hypothetical protein